MSHLGVELRCVSWWGYMNQLLRFFHTHLRQPLTGVHTATSGSQTAEYLGAVTCSQDVRKVSRWFLCEGVQ